MTEQEWRERLAAVIDAWAERHERQRQHRAALAERRTAGKAARHAARIAAIPRPADHIRRRRP
jgi:hypothetical protein